MALSDIDRKLLQRCLTREPRAWEIFVDRFLGLVLHVVRHTAKSRSLPLSAQDEEDLVAEFFLTVISDDFALLRRFRGESSLGHLPDGRRPPRGRAGIAADDPRRRGWARPPRSTFRCQHRGRGPGSPEERISNREEVERLMRQSDRPRSGRRADVPSGRQVLPRDQFAIGMPENSIGPTLSRARAKMRQATAIRRA